MFQLLIVINRRSNFVYHHWQCFDQLEISLLFLKGGINQQNNFMKELEIDIEKYKLTCNKSSIIISNQKQEGRGHWAV